MLPSSRLFMKDSYMNGAIYVSDSGNTKIMGSQKVDATYASIESTCPNSCALKDEGCYAQTSYVGMVSNRLDKEAKKHSPLKVARAEANAIDNSYGAGTVPQGRDMRLHVSGDSRTIAGTRIINNAVGRWRKRGGGDCWTYTHAYKHVPRNEWHNVSILASVTSVDEVVEAKKMGYAPAIVVPEFSGDKAFKLEGSDVKWIPCPAQTREVPCVNCRLCFNANRLFEQNMGIAFAAHGVKKNIIRRRLQVIQ